jgi:hypothetical protein
VTTDKGGGKSAEQLIEEYSGREEANTVKSGNIFGEKVGINL